MVTISGDSLLDGVTTNMSGGRQPLEAALRRSGHGRYEQILRTGTRVTLSESYRLRGSREDVLTNENER